MGPINTADVEQIQTRITFYSISMAFVHSNIIHGKFWSCLTKIAQSICTHYSRFENMGWFVTLKKIRSKIWTWKKAGCKKQVHCYLKPDIFRFIFWTWFFSGSQTDPCCQNKNRGCRLTRRICPNWVVDFWLETNLIGDIGIIFQIWNNVFKKTCTWYSKMGLFQFTF